VNIFSHLVPIPLSFFSTAGHHSLLVIFLPRLFFFIVLSGHRVCAIPPVKTRGQSVLGCI